MRIVCATPLCSPPVSFCWCLCPQNGFYRPKISPLSCQKKKKKAFRYMSLKQIVLPHLQWHPNAQACFFPTKKRKKRKKKMREKHWMSSATYVTMIKTCLELAWERIYFWLWCDLSDVWYPEFAKYSKSILIDLTVKVFYKDYFYIFLHSWLNICKIRLCCFMLNHVWIETEC